jgi:putative ABC transport system permease protein
MRIASPDYFKTLGIPLIQGRTFEENDDEKALAVAVINRKMAKHHWGDDDPVGRRISFNRGETWIKIVGVVGDVREMGLHREPGDEIYLPMAQSPALGNLVVRTAQDPKSLAAQLRRDILDTDPQIALTNVVTLEEAKGKSLSSQRTTADLLGLFAVLALVIAATGIGGILALSVSERLHEIGIRIALGARSTHVLRDVIGRGVGLVVLGVAVGWAGALAFTGMLKALLFQVTPTDPITFWGVSAILIGAAFVASYLPARRATQIDPLIALRSE